MKELERACHDCQKCDIGRATLSVKAKSVSTHVFSSMTTSHFFIVGQNPGKTECLYGSPFLGAAGKNFFNEIAKHGYSRKDFYITNAVKCFTPKNRKPTKVELANCRHFLHSELEALEPKLIITLGAFSYNAIKPGFIYKDNVGILQEVEINNKKYLLFPIYHPSPMNLCVAERREQFDYDVATLADLMTSNAVLGYSPN